MAEYKNITLSLDELLLDPNNPRFYKPIDCEGKNISDVQDLCMTLLKSNDLAPEKQKG